MTPPTLDGLAARLPTRWLGRPLEIVAETGSTNDDVLARARAGAPHGLCIFAEAQTRGRGRLGRVWSSPAAGNLYFSALLRIQAAPMVTLAAGLAVQEALNALGARASIKWPNDVMIDGAKVAGILTEASTRGMRMEALALGIGVNVNAETVPQELAGKATSLRLALGAPVDRVALAARLLERLEHWLGAEPAAVIDAFRARAGLFGRPVRVVAAGAARSGVARDLGDDGALIVEAEDGAILRVTSGEIEVR